MDTSAPAFTVWKIGSTKSKPLTSEWSVELQDLKVIFKESGDKGIQYSIPANEAPFLIHVTENQPASELQLPDDFLRGYILEVNLYFNGTASLYCINEFGLARLVTWLFDVLESPQEATYERIRRVGPPLLPTDPYYAMGCTLPRRVITGNSLAEVEKIIAMVSMEIRERQDFLAWIITLSDYALDPRDLWEIEEVRQWFRLVHERYPFFPCLLQPASSWLYFISIVPTSLQSREKKILSREETILRDLSIHRARIAGLSTPEIDRLRVALETRDILEVDTQSLTELWRVSLISGAHFFNSLGLSQKQLERILQLARFRLSAGFEIKK